MMSGLITQIKEYPVALTGIAIALVLAVLILLNGNRLPELEQEEAELISQLKRMERNAVNAVHLDQQLAEARQLVGAIDDRLMNLQDRTVNFRHFLALEEQFGVVLSDPRLATDLPGRSGSAHYGSIHYRIAIRGLLNNCLGFVEKLRTGLYLVRIHSLELTAGGVGDEVVMQVDFRVMGKHREASQ